MRREEPRQAALQFESDPSVGPDLPEGVRRRCRELLGQLLGGIVLAERTRKGKSDERENSAKPSR